MQLNDAQALRTNDRPAYQEEDVCWSGAPMCKPCMSIHYAGWCVMYIDTELIPELRGLSYDEIFEIALENGYGCERKIDGGLVVNIPYNPYNEWHYSQTNSMLTIEAQMWWESLGWFDKIYWSIWIKYRRIRDKLSSKID